MISVRGVADFFMMMSSRSVFVFFVRDFIILNVMLITILVIMIIMIAMTIDRMYGLVM